MVDRQELDALLIGALYGELTPADEARLAAHLESHPADRNALEGLKTAREAVRDSHVFDVQAEPPQALSAMLLQEAHRRAPRARSESPTESWLSRFLRVFVAHPAMAAATTLVLVVGVAGTMYVRQGKLKTAEPSFAQGSGDSVAAAPALQPPQVPPAGAPAGTTTEAALDTGTAAGSGSATGEVARVDLAAPQHAAAVDKPKGNENLRKEFDSANYRSSQNAIAFDDEAKQQLAKKPMPTRAPAVGKKAGYLEVQKNDLGPKDLDESQVADTLSTQQPAQQRASYGGASSGGGTGGGNAPSGTAANAAPVAQSKVAQSKVAQSTAQMPPPPPMSQAAPTTTVAKPAKSAPQDPAPALHAELAQAEKLAHDNKCDETAKVTENIRQESAAFYAQNVADNMKLKGCLTYVRGEAERNNQIARKKAAKAKPTSTDEGSTPPAAAAPVAAPPADADQAPAKK